MKKEESADIGRMILVPALITLAITLLRLVGELQGWSPALFSREAGGGGAIVGLSRLVILFGGWFGVKLALSGETPESMGKAFGITMLALAVLPVLGVISAAAGVNQQGLGALAVYMTGSVFGLFVALRAWPRLGRLLLAYGFAARIPVVLVMLAAMLGNWGTHYDVPPPGFPETGVLAKWLLIGVLPQMTFWIWFTVVIGSIVGIVAAAIEGRRRAAA